MEVEGGLEGAGALFGGLGDGCAGQGVDEGAFADARAAGQGDDEQVVGGGGELGAEAVGGLADACGVVGSEAEGVGGSDVFAESVEGVGGGGGHCGLLKVAVRRAASAAAAARSAVVAGTW